ncbi:hypothetical protein DXG01_007667 [Tephrocybe rancida]|nr:hypothetical protein DXG01_007667 [Tephrocybe rancida]
MKRLDMSRGLHFEDEGIPRRLLQEYTHMDSFSPLTRFTTLKIKCEHPMLDMWDVAVERPNGIRVIDIFEEIYKTYNAPLKQDEFHEDADMPPCQKAYARRCWLSRGRTQDARERGTYRVDLLANRTLFNSIFYNDAIHQYHFRLSERPPDPVPTPLLFKICPFLYK